jgi:hypothetical protein
MTDEKPRRRAVASFTALDWIGVAITGIAALGLILLPRIAGPPMVTMYEDFGSELPTITQLVLTGWFPLLLAQPTLALVVVALLRRHSMLASRLLVAGGFVLTLVFGALCLYAFYLPIFGLVEMIE